MNNNKYDKIIKSATKGMDSKSIKDLENNKKVQEALQSLTDEQIKAVENILSNPKETEKILSSPQAQMLMKKLMEDK